MLDNFSITNIHQAVTFTRQHNEKNSQSVKLEVSGNMALDTIAQYGQTQVDFISVGALTKHLHAIDLSMRFSALT
jgi:nicotinate-nucleotide pyrophosphorylase (carboxylating)